MRIIRIYLKNQKNMKKLAYLLLPLISIALGGCANNQSSNTLKLATTFAPVYDFVSRIVKDKAEIINIVGDNEPHEFSPSDPKTSSFCERADVLFAYGEGLDSWSMRMNENKYFEITSNVEFIQSGNATDPHAYLSLRDSKIMLKNIKNKMIEVDPKNAEFYNANYAKAIEEFEVLDDRYNSELALDKLNSRYIVTSHEAFAYLARDYSLVQKGIADIADHEPSASKIAQIKKFIMDNNIKYIFLEELDEKGHVETIVSELKKDNYEVSYEVLSAYEGVSETSYANGETYLKAMEDNLEILKRCLTK